MNRKQLVALWIGIALFVLVGLFPPWTEFEPRWGELMERQRGHVFLFPPPAPEFGPRARVSVNREILLISWALISVVTFGAVLTLADKKQKGGRE